MPEPSLDYFLADKQGAELTGTLITEACQALRHNRDDYLALVGNEPIIAKLIEVANPITSYGDRRSPPVRRRPVSRARCSPPGSTPVSPTGRRKNFSCC